jgi:predicted alpha-1,6-mannanase (GH76 family)
MAVGIALAVISGGALAAGGCARAAQPPARVYAPGSASPTAAQADACFNAFNSAFYVEVHGAGYYRAHAGGRARASFWRSAEMLEMVEDAYDRCGKPLYRHMVVALHRGMIKRFGANWLRRKYNDDVMWMVIASLRAYAITGDARYLSLARHNFDGAYARAWSRDHGGGLWWTTDRHEKNACVNLPAAIAACLLYRATADSLYLRKAEGLYAWVRGELFDPRSGAVADHVSGGDIDESEGSSSLDRVTFTYNQGTFIGAADLLERYTGAECYRRDGLRALAYARRCLSRNGVLRSEGAGGDGGGFKGIFVRWAVRYTRDNNVPSASAWLSQNAMTAWASRNARGLMDEDWISRTREGPQSSFDCSSAVVLLQSAVQ